MVDPSTLRRWRYRLLLIGLCVLCTFTYLLPLGLGQRHWPGPDLILALCFAWVLRRPRYVPVWLAAPIFLLADFVFMRPPGPWAALSLIALEFLRRREREAHDLPFPLEWALVSGILFAMAILYRIILAVSMTPMATLGLVMLEQISTALAYPLVVLITGTVFGIRKPNPADIEEELRGVA